MRLVSVCDVKVKDFISNSKTAKMIIPTTCKKLRTSLIKYCCTINTKAPTLAGIKKPPRRLAYFVS